ncbi:MAG: radical SAM protein [Thermoplasmata archaeon]
MWPIRDVRYQVTHACNLHCPHCFSKADKPLPDELTLDEAKELVLDLKASGMRMITLTGGEPLCRKQFTLDLASFLGEQGIRYRVFTNGLRMTEEVASNLKKSDAYELQVSFDGLRESHDAFRGTNGSFDKAVKALEIARDAGLRTAVRATVTNRNSNEMVELLDVVCSLGISAFRLRPFVPVGRGKEHKEFVPSREDFERAFGRLSGAKGRYPIQVTFIMPHFTFIFDSGRRHHSSREFEGIPCVCGKTLAAITPNGWVRPCGYFSVNLGNVRQQKFSEIWENSEFLQKMRNIERLEDRCMECEFLSLCRGGCRASAYENTGRLDAADPLCPLVF